MHVYTFMKSPSNKSFCFVYYWDLQTILSTQWNKYPSIICTHLSWCAAGGWSIVLHAFSLTEKTGDSRRTCKLLVSPREFVHWFGVLAGSDPEAASQCLHEGTSPNKSHLRDCKTFFCTHGVYCMFVYLGPSLLFQTFFTVYHLRKYSPLSVILSSNYYSDSWHRRQIYSS